ncbi:MAG: YjgP/YjgQ family permease [Oligoflexales bacterium]|nr:YjgP/YjgQ family permease [Oligoflexales bacterium]
MIVFCAVIVVSQLVRLSNVLVTFGLTAENILLPFLYIIVPFLQIIIPISYLFGIMISFSRLSSDGEITALLAAGYSVKRAMLPALMIAFTLYIAGALCAIHLEAWGRREFVQFIYRKTQTEIDNMVRFKIQAGVFLNDFLDYVFYTEKISENRTHYKNVLLAPRNKSKDNFVILSPDAQITGSVAEGNLRMVLFEGVSYSLDAQTERSSSLTFKRAEIDLLRVFQEKIIGEDTARDDYRSYTAKDLRSYVKKMEESPTKHPDFLKASYLYYSRFANPFIVFAFTFFGIIMGIQEQRHGKNRGYLGSILVIISCFVIMVAFRWLAENAHIPPLVASWFPQLMVLLFASFCIFQKSRLPPSEPILALKNFPRLPINLGKRSEK